MAEQKGETTRPPVNYPAPQREGGGERLLNAGGEISRGVRWATLGEGGWPGMTGVAKAIDTAGEPLSSPSSSWSGGNHGSTQTDARTAAHGVAAGALGTTAEANAAGVSGIAEMPGSVETPGTAETRGSAETQGSAKAGSSRELAGGEGGSDGGDSRIRHHPRG